MNEEEFSKDELDALKKLAKERVAYDTITGKIKGSWIIFIGGGILAWFTLSDKIIALINGVK